MIEIQYETKLNMNLSKTLWIILPAPSLREYDLTRILQCLKNVEILESTVLKAIYHDRICTVFDSLHKTKSLHSSMRSKTKWIASLAKGCIYIERQRHVCDVTSDITPINSL